MQEPKIVRGNSLPVVITVYTDKSFDFVIKTPPAAVQLLEAAKLKKGSPESNRNKVGTVTWDQVKEIAENKMVDLNAFTVESAMKMVAGTARSMGVVSERHSSMGNSSVTCVINHLYHKGSHEPWR